MNLILRILRFANTGKRGTAVSVVGMMLVVAVPVFAHNGVEHIGGTVSKVSGNVLTLKTSTGNVDVTLNDKTVITKNSKRGQLSDLMPGTRVQVDVPEDSSEKVARAVKVGATPVADHDAHDHDDHNSHK